MIEILRVLAEGTATLPRRSASTPLARSLRYQLTSNSPPSHRSLRLFTRSRLVSSPLPGPNDTTAHAADAAGLTAIAGHGTVARDGGDPTDPRRDDRHGRRHWIDPVRGGRAGRGRPD